MNETIFDIKEKLPINIVIIPFDHNIERLTGYIDIIISDTKLYLTNNTNFTINDIVDIPINVKSISVKSEDSHFLLNNFMNTIIFTTSSYFITTYINGFKVKRQSNN